MLVPRKASTGNPPLFNGAGTTQFINPFPLGIVYMGDDYEMEKI